MLAVQDSWSIACANTACTVNQCQWGGPKWSPVYYREGTMDNNDYPSVAYSFELWSVANDSLPARPGRLPGPGELPP